MKKLSGANYVYVFIFILTFLTGVSAFEKIGFSGASLALAEPKATYSDKVTITKFNDVEYDESGNPTGKADDMPPQPSPAKVNDDKSVAEGGYKVPARAVTTNNVSNVNEDAPSEIKKEPEPVRPSKLYETGFKPFGKGSRSSAPSTIKVSNGTQTDAVVKLINLDDNRMVRNFYIRSGDDYTENNIKAGDYIMRTAFGSDWDNDKKKFMTNRSFSETDKFIAVEERTSQGTKYSNIRITLNKVVGGNFKSENIDEEKFDD